MKRASLFGFLLLTLPMFLALPYAFSEEGAEEIIIEGDTIKIIGKRKTPAEAAPEEKTLERKTVSWEESQKQKKIQDQLAAEKKIAAENKRRREQEERAQRKQEYKEKKKEGNWPWARRQYLKSQRTNS